MAELITLPRALTEVKAQKAQEPAGKAGTYHRVCRHGHAPFYISLVWLLALVALVPNFFVGSLEYEPSIYSCTFIRTASTQYTAAMMAI